MAAPNPTRPPGTAAYPRLDRPFSLRVLSVVFVIRGFVHRAPEMELDRAGVTWDRPAKTGGGAHGFARRPRLGWGTIDLRYCPNAATSRTYLVTTDKLRDPYRGIDEGVHFSGIDGRRPSTNVRQLVHAPPIQTATIDAALGNPSVVLTICAGNHW